MSVKALMEYTRVAKYARYNERKKRRETWKEQVDRVMDMHITHLGEKYESIKEDVDFAREFLYAKRVLGSQRALQFGGSAILNKNERLYNCSFSHADRVDFFKELMYLCLCGVGCGFSVQTHHIAKLPKIAKRDPDQVITHVIPDSIEGWSDAIDMLVRSYFVGTEYTGKTITFDYSEIRPAGALIKSSGAKAPGPDGLRRSLNKITELLDLATRDISAPIQMKSIIVYDIVMHASDAVVSGGIRRAATICIFSHEDNEMLSAKTGNWFVENPQRGRSNNSAMLIRDDISHEQFASIFESVKQYGEPGFIFADDKEAGFNPCFHRDTRLTTSNGLVKISDLYANGTENVVAVDNRMGTGDNFQLNNYGVSAMDATKVELTAKNASIYKMTLDNGAVVKCTDYHEFPTMFGRKKLKDLSIGDTLFLPSGRGLFGDNSGSYDDGLILGLIAGDGVVCNNDAFIDVWEDDFCDLDYIKNIVQSAVSSVQPKLNRDYPDLDWMDQSVREESPSKKRIGGKRLYRYISETLGVNPSSLKTSVPEIIFRGNQDFVRGYIAGMLFADGSVQMTSRGKKTTLSVRLNQSNSEYLREFQMLLMNFGIVSKIYSRRNEGLYELPDGLGGSKLYECKENFDLIINRPNSVVLMNDVGLFGRKATTLKEYFALIGAKSRKPERFIATIKSIEFDSIDDVFCLTQKDTNTVVANGIVAGQCVEIGLYPRHDVTDESGWAFCNLTEINMKKAKTKEEFFDACRAGSILGSIQASYTSFPYLGSVTEYIVRREALIGVSMTGMMDSPDVAFDAEIQQEGARIVKETNARIAKMIGINAAARTTCVKPAGSTSCILGSSSGIHPHHSKRYFRRVQANSLETPLQFFKLYNPKAVDKSVWDSNGKTEVITFLCEVPDSAKTKVQIGAIELLEHVKLTQQNWVNYGTNEHLNVKPWLRHNVSNTCFSSETEFITSDGIKQFNDYLDGDVVNVMCYDNQYRPATIKNFGKQNLMKLIISDGKAKSEIYVTENHLWMLTNARKRTIDNKSLYTQLGSYNGYMLCATKDLKAHKTMTIPKMSPIKQDMKFNTEAFCHGFVFGDGSKHYSRENSKCFIEIYDKCKKNIVKHFNELGYESIDHGKSIYVGKLPTTWKDLPDEERSNEYIHSFIAGWFAADGSVSKEQRVITITCKSKEAMEWLRIMSPKVGIGVNSINSFVQKVGYNPGMTYYITSFVKSTLSDVFFVGHEDKYNRWIEMVNRSVSLQPRKSFKVVSVEKTDRYEDVWCVVEPVTESFVLGNYALTHNCTVKDREWDGVRDFIYENRNYFAGISLLPIAGDKDYPQAPFVAVYTPTEIVDRYGDASMMASGIIVDGLRAFDDDLWKACSCACGINQMELEMPDLSNMKPKKVKEIAEKIIERNDWVRRAKKFATNYFVSDEFPEGDVRKMTYLLKDVHNWKTWCDLKREYQDVPWEDLEETTDTTKLSETVACSGGKCDTSLEV